MSLLGVENRIKAATPAELTANSSNPQAASVTVIEVPHGQSVSGELVEAATVLRQAMAGDARDPAGLYFGTNSGSVFASLDDGDNWQEIVRHLPTILAVEVLDR